ncbi:MAG: CDP-diacylglycerol--glycerol-3-phosphate 3-phosphatidyltransferase [Acidobacteria bacterium]|nr:CDP-diacylglycerol--glycerol-3-phosphate 3-phosphatidyltransferase [Acidobacteriota bacterium]
MNLPNALTLLRIFIVPLLVVVLLTQPKDWFGIPQHVFGVAIFLIAAATDWLDGYLARRRGQVSTLGIMLDPIADKLLISAAFIALVDNRLAPAWAVVVIIGREFAVSGLRSIAATEGVMIAASRMGKFKMLTQVIAIALLITSMEKGGPPVTPYAVPVYWAAPAFWNVLKQFYSTQELSTLDVKILLYSAGRAMLWLVVVSSIWSMYGYFRAFYVEVRNKVDVRNRRRLRMKKEKEEDVAYPVESSR